MLHRFLSSWFGFNKQQRNGILVLCFIILVLFIIRLSLHSFIQPKPILIADFSETDLSFLDKSKVAGDTLESENNEALFVFDPNTVSKEQLLRLGFKDKTASTFIKYRSKGAIFKSKEDLKKVYGVTDELYNKLEPYIIIENKTETVTLNAKTETAAKKKGISIIELNAADSAALLPLPGIGAGYAKRIIKYRSLLGGFYSIEQLKEVYGFTDSLFIAIKNYVKTDASLITKLNINTENFKELNAHPYISYEETKAIFNYRRKNGTIKSQDQLKEIVGAETLNKIIPYLGF